MAVPVPVVVAAVSVSTSLPLLWWAVFAGRESARASRNLSAGLASVTDLRKLALTQSASDRALMPAIRNFGHRVRALTPVAYAQRLEHKAILAGRANTWTVDRILVAKLFTTAASAVLVPMLLKMGNLGPLLAIFAVVLGFFTPDVILGGRAAERQTQIRRELPDTIDQITVTVEAGLGLESAIARVARAGGGPLASELTRMLQDIQVGVARVQALRRLLERTDVDELRQFVNALIQAETYGVPVARVLRIQATELREKRRQYAEEQAMKLPVKVLFPLITCIMPTLVIVLMGPAVMDIMNLFKNMKR